VTTNVRLPTASKRSSSIRNVPPPTRGRGLVYEDKGDHDRAITDYGKAIELDPKLAFVYGLRAIAFAKKGDKQHVIADFQKALTLDPGNEGFKKALSDIGKLP
jgi:tetratricopeptide (TPR) repeat protein